MGNIFSTLCLKKLLIKVCNKNIQELQLIIIVFVIPMCCNAPNKVGIKDNLLTVCINILHYVCPNFLFLLVGTEANS